jgi:hypothetical protein
MAKKMGRPKTSTRQDVSIKFDRVLAARARQVALNRGLSLAEYLSEACRAVVDRDYAKVLRELEGGGD